MEQLSACLFCASLSTVHELLYWWDAHRCDPRHKGTCTGSCRTCTVTLPTCTAMWFLTDVAWFVLLFGMLWRWNHSVLALAHNNVMMGALVCLLIARCWPTLTPRPAVMLLSTIVDVQRCKLCRWPSLRPLQRPIKDTAILAHGTFELKRLCAPFPISKVNLLFMLPGWT